MLRVAALCVVLVARGAERVTQAVLVLDICEHSRNW